MRPALLAAVCVVIFSCNKSRGLPQQQEIAPLCPIHIINFLEYRGGCELPGVPGQKEGGQ